MLTAKFALTSDCNLRCSYCFIDKERSELMTREGIADSLEKIVGSPGKVKAIGIYGGEPLLHAPLVEFLVQSARALEKRHRKLVRLSLATNGLRLTEARLHFFRDHDVMLCVSIDGRSNDRLRKDAEGRGYLKALLRKLDLVFSVLPTDRVMALQGVYPANVGTLSDDFGFLRSLGFSNINLEVIQGGPAWMVRHERLFDTGLADIRRTILAGATDGEHAFLHFVNRELYRLHSRVVNARALEVYPSGGVGAIPYPFLHMSEKPDQESVRDALEPGQRVLRRRAKFSSALALDLTALSAKKQEIAGYVRKAAGLGSF